VGDLADPALRHVDALGQAVLGDPHRVEEFRQQDLTGMYRGKISFGGHRAPRWYSTISTSKASPSRQTQHIRHSFGRIAFHRC